MGVESESWMPWYRAHGAALLLFARQWLPDRNDAEDALQEAFIRFWKTRDSAHDPAAYLFACVRNCAREAVRGELRRSRRDETVARHEGEPLFECPLERDERRAAVESALQDLPEEQREVLVLKIWGELTFGQISTTLGISANTAASRYRYALEKLRVALVAEVVR